MCFVTLHVAVVACSCALIRHSNDKKCLRTHAFLDSCHTFDFRRKHAHCIKRILSRSRRFSATCSCMWSLLMRWPERGEFFFFHSWHTVALQAFPKPSELDYKLWPIGKVLHRLCADRVHVLCKNVEAHFNILDGLAQ